jgi:hypothetical protein
MILIILVSIFLFGILVLVYFLTQHKKCPNNCSKNGKCNLKTGNCICNTGYVGSDCSKKGCKSCYSKGGDCDIDTGKCICKKGWEGEQCNQKTCLNNCSGKGLCINGTCKCYDGFTGDDCSQNDCLNPCTKYGNCVKGNCVCTNPLIGGITCGDCVDRTKQFPGCTTLWEPLSKELINNLLQFLTSSFKQNISITIDSDLVNKINKIIVDKYNFSYFYQNYFDFFKKKLSSTYFPTNNNINFMINLINIIYSNLKIDPNICIQNITSIFPLPANCIKNICEQYNIFAFSFLMFLQNKSKELGIPLTKTLQDFVGYIDVICNISLN